ncbi:MAG: type II CAAX endopeptidase family protein [Bacillota bacterium]|nr:type II CAAX endopeptidase family protein [Bacillota bacterium]
MTSVSCPAPASPPGLRWHLFDLVLIIFLALLLVPGLVYALLGHLGEKSWAVLAVTYAQEFSLALLTLGSLKYGYQVRAQIIGLERRDWPRQVGWGLLFGVGLVAINALGTELGVALFRLLLPPPEFERIMGWEREALASFLPGRQPPLLLALTFTLIVVVAPFAEEVFFRGFSFTALRDRWGPAAALWGTAFLFALVHSYLIQFLPLFLVGAALAWQRRAGFSLLSCIVAHGVLNGVVFLLAVAFPAP